MVDNGANQSKFRTKILVEIDDGAHLILELKQNNKNVDFLGCYSRGNLANVKDGVFAKNLDEYGDVGDSLGY